MTNWVLLRSPPRLKCCTPVVIPVAAVILHVVHECFQRVLARLRCRLGQLARRNLILTAMAFHFAERLAERVHRTNVLFFQSAPRRFPERSERLAKWIRTEIHIRSVDVDAGHATVCGSSRKTPSRRSWSAHSSTANQWK